MVKVIAKKSCYLNKEGKAMKHKYCKHYFLIIAVSLFIPLSGESQKANQQSSDIRLLRIFQGEEHNYRLGLAIDALGDINRDGYDDFAIGVPGANSERGRVDIYFGHPNPDSMEKRTISGSPLDVYFGYNLKNIGDINGDGKTDLFIVSHNATRDYEIVHIYTGNDTGWFDYSKSLSGKHKYDDFGYELCGCDINGDGYGDFIIGAPDYNFHMGKVYIYLGGNTIPDQPYTTIQGDSVGAYFAGSLAGIGDVNSDGYDDFVVGGPLGDPGGIINAGYFKLYFGGAEIDTIADIELAGTRMYGEMGRTFCSGYFNGDQAMDLIVGSDGEAFVYFGGSDMDSIPDLIFGTPEIPAGFLSYAGDINGDGYSDLLSGNPYWGMNNGLVDIYLGSKNFNSLYDHQIHGEWASYFGWTLSTAGDVNGDGLDEFLVGEPRYFLDIQLQGRVYLFSGDSTLVRIDDSEPSPAKHGSFQITGNYPNPFNDTTTFRYSVTNKGIYYVNVFNVYGQLIFQKKTSHHSPGHYDITWNGKDSSGNRVSSGLYLVTLVHNGYQSNPQKILLLK
jgi:hypothetical protein